MHQFRLQLAQIVMLSVMLSIITACGGSSGNSANSKGDTVPPVISLQGPNPYPLYIHSTYAEPGATAEDNVDGDVSVSSSTDLDTSVAGSYTVIYTATDSSDNTATAEREVVVIGERLSNLSCLPPEPESGDPGAVTIEASFPDLPLMGSPLAMIQPTSDSSFWWVALRAGRIVRFDNLSTVSSYEEVLDISSRVTTEFERGMTGLAVHPDYPQDNRLFVVYNDSSNQGRSTLSSFTVNTDTHLVDANSEIPLLTLPQPAGNHNGGDMAFGLDGYLYVSFGDGGADRNESQDLSTLHGTIIRIDVNAQPYAIPDDNPFNTEQSLCDTGSRASGSCPEIYAYGFRNPWRFSFDQLTGELWVADVGQSTFEEVNRVVAGANYGWPIMEGDQCFNDSSCETSGLALPITQYGRSVGVSTVGGYVYRGESSPSLSGLYIWGDTFSSEFLSVSANAEEGSDYTPMFNSARVIAAMAQGNDGEIYLLNLQGDAGDEVHRVVASGGTTVQQMPSNLSDLGCFDTTAKTYPDGVLNYQLNAPLWSDTAAKDRAFAIPDGTVISVDAAGDFLFPEDTVLIKHFLDQDRYLETRLLIRFAGGWQGFSYQWNQDESDAVLLEQGTTVDVGDFVHTFPSRSDCIVCHTAAANTSLGLEVAQLNRIGPVATNNQLDLMSDLGYFESEIDSEQASRLYALSDQSASVEQRARSYLHSNCSNCHRPGAQGGFMDLRFDTPLSNTNICDVAPTDGDLGVNDARRVAPGDASRSVLLLRMQRLDSNRMPPLASLMVDEEATVLIENWINSLTACD